MSDSTANSSDAAANTAAAAASTAAADTIRCYFHIYTHRTQSSFIQTLPFESTDSQPLLA